MKKLLSILSLLFLFIIGQEIMAATSESVTDKKQTAVTSNEKALWEEGMEGTTLVLLVFRKMPFKGDWITKEPIVLFAGA